ncbi:IclR family transcriptional regulator [Thermoactinomyces mirandus]|uniref:IclR family transcriptional regulator n=1 Tax=Thermoactinomyces mirandus TaxID=2756294 RepID=A0A7W1XSV1_9BACL|nr:IclR family transcriptional regulator [Thermoactinomyces mirandus]MBA4602522.1 IclR family transcriptional regulator [Thermoactinomyces mirandus]
MRRINIEPNKSLLKAIQILECFSENKQFLTAETISRLTGFPKTTVYRTLYTLEMAGLIHFREENNTYCLGVKLLEFGGIVLSRFHIRYYASPYLTPLHHQTGFTVLLGILEGDRLMYIDKRESYEHHKYTSPIGKARSPHYGILGKTLMASLDDEKIQEILDNIPLKSYTDQSITDPASFRMELKKIREKGYAIDQEEVVPHVFGVGAPIKNKWGKTVAAIAVVGPKKAFLEFPLTEIVLKVQHCVKQIASEINT